jgi:hypothetical protein
MSWNKREYHFYLAFCKRNIGKEFWQENEWFNSLEPLFRKIIELAPFKMNETGIRLSEYSLGKLNWDEKSHKKWLYKINEKVNFLDFESWTPRWTICDKNNNAPDVFIKICNEDIYGGKMQLSLQFDFLVIISIATNVGNISNEIIIKLSEAFNSKRTVYNIRTWGKGKKDNENRWEFINSIQDTTSFGIYNDAIKLDFHTIEFDKIIFEPYWKIMY